MACSYLGTLPIFCLSLILLLIIYSQLHLFVEAIPFCSECGVYSLSAFFHREILLFHHLAFKFLCFLLCQQPSDLCVFIYTAFCDPHSSFFKFLSATL